MTMETDKAEQDPRVAAAWSECSVDLPAATLDANILAAAHRAVGSAPHDAGIPGTAARSTRRWRIPLAAAASICVVTLGIFLTRPQQQIILTPSVTGPSALQAPVRDEPTLAASKDSPPAASLEAAPKPLPAEKKLEHRESSIADRRANAALPAAAPAPSAARARMATGGAAADSMAPFDVDASVLRIRQLHDAGQLTAAAEELLALRAAVADADQRLPTPLRAWAATIKP